MKDTNSRITKEAAECLNEATGLPFWEAAEKSEAKQPYAVKIVIPDVRSMYAGDDIRDFLSQQGLDKGQVIVQEKDSVRKEFRADGDTPPTSFTLVLQGKKPEEFNATVDAFCKHFPEHPELLNLWLKSNPHQFIDKLKATLETEDSEVFNGLRIPPGTHEVNALLQHLSALAVSRDQPRQAVQASKILNIIEKQVPALGKHLFDARVQSRMPAIIGEDTGKHYFADRMELQKAGVMEVNPFPGHHPHYNFERFVTKLSQYAVTFHCKSNKDANELELHIRDALKAVAESEPPFRPYDNHGRPQYSEHERLGGGFGTSINIRQSEDGKTLIVSPPLLLDDVYTLYSALKEHIKPTLQLAQDMDWARHAEYRGEVAGYSEAHGYGHDKASIKYVHPSMQRGAGYEGMEQKEMFNTMLADIAGMAMTKGGTAEIAGGQLTQLGHLLASGVVEDPEGRYPDIRNRLSGKARSGSALATQEYVDVVGEYTRGLTKNLVTALKANGMKINEADSLGVQLQAIAQQGAPLVARDEALHTEREDAAHAAALERQEKEGGRFLSKEYKAAAIATKIAAVAAIKTDRALALYKGGLGTASAEPQTPLIDRPYPLIYDDPFSNRKNITATPLYWSRCGLHSIREPRLELPEELQVILDRAKAQGVWSVNTASQIAGPSR